ncbi:MAG TPA: non-heme iron oxygenase ferredoxin subunit [Steroidobacteraceae bacterium]|jgi:3-phenylpropionate/trans-cinnamate dioxygenase ferredoxin subunit|nr:non-heme iron oxygenase ferredoxin subunit [Steroidobacteraceae bacterium]
MSWVDVGSAADLQESTPLSVEIDGMALLVVRCGNDLYAVDDRCTHDGEALDGAEIESCQIICPRHGARFCLRTGEALTPPAYEPLGTFEVRTENGRILVAQPE